MRYFLLLVVTTSFLNCSTRNNASALWKEVSKEDSLRHFYKSIFLYDKIIKMDLNDSSNVIAFTNRGRAKISSGDTLNGVMDLDKALSIIPMPQTLITKALIEMNKDASHAVTYMYRAKNLAPTNPIVYYTLLGYFTTVMVNNDSAMFYADHIVKHFKNYSPMSALVMSTYLNNNQFDKLIEITNLIISNDQSNAFAYNNRGFAEMNKGNYNSAKKDIHKSISLNPTNSYAFKNLGLLFLRIDNVDSACACFISAANLGYKNMYGEEVDSLTSAYCTDKRKLKP